MIKSVVNNNDFIKNLEAALVANKWKKIVDYNFSEDEPVPEGYHWQKNIYYSCHYLKLVDNKFLQIKKMESNKQPAVYYREYIPVNNIAEIVFNRKGIDCINFKN